MAVMKRKGVFYLYFRPFKDKKIGLKLDVESKIEAKAMEVMLLRSCRTGDYSTLDPVAREACIRMFDNQGWELPSELGGRTAPKEELCFWKAAELFLRYPEIRENRERPRYEMCLIHLTEHFGKDRPVRSIWVPEIKQYVALRLGKNASPSTVNREKGTLSKIFQVLVELQLVDANPCSLIKNLSQKSEERQAYISFRDVQRIAEKTPEWFRPLVWLAYYAGMRRGEVMGLTRRQVNLAKRLITLAPPDTKERGWKRIPLRKEVISILEESMRVSSLESDKVFLLRDSKGIRPVSLEGFKNPWERACKALGLTKPWPRFHDLRHTWRANARRSRMDPAIAEAILGHWFRGRTVNERYGRIGDKELIEAIDSMQFALGDTEILVASTKNVVDGNKKGNKLATNEVEKEERSRTSVT